MEKYEKTRPKINAPIITVPTGAKQPRAMVIDDLRPEENRKDNFFFVLIYDGMHNSLKKMPGVILRFNYEAK